MDLGNRWGEVIVFLKSAAVPLGLGGKFGILGGKFGAPQAPQGGNLGREGNFPKFRHRRQGGKFLDGI